MSTDPSSIVQKVEEAARNVRLGRGVVSKTSYVAAAVVVVWGVVVWRLGGDSLANAFLFGAALLVTTFAFWFIRGTQQFAERNPGQAMLDGAEFIEYRKLEVQAKGQPPQTETILVIDQSAPAVAPPIKGLPRG
jgi:hypothetical protein